MFQDVSHIFSHLRIPLKDTKKGYHYGSLLPAVAAGAALRRSLRDHHGAAAPLRRRRGARARRRDASGALAGPRFWGRAG